MSTYKISRLFTYPIKSLRGIELAASPINRRGLQWDRRWMLVDETGQFFTQRTVPQMTLLQPRIEGNQLMIQSLNTDLPTLSVALSFDGLEDIEVTVWKDTLMARTVSPVADRWFSEALERPCRLVVMPDQAERPTKGTTTSAQQWNSFSDAYPLLILGEAAFNHLNGQLESSIQIQRFRPNIVFSGGTPHDEDRWHHFKIGQALFESGGPCARCAVPNIDPETGKSSLEPTKTLVTYRYKDREILFGLNAMPKAAAPDKIRLGDSIQVLSWQK